MFSFATEVPSEILDLDNNLKTKTNFANALARCTYGLIIHLPDPYKVGSSQQIV